MAVDNSPLAGKKHAGGRPPLYADVNEMDKIIDKYFVNCDNRIQYVYSKKRDDVVEVINPEPYTMAGLAYALGMDRQTLLNYSKKDQFIGTIKKARNRVHLDVERRLMDGAGVGAIFSLKNNFGWLDQSQVDNTVHLPKPILGAIGVRSDDSDTQNLIP